MCVLMFRRIPYLTGLHELSACYKKGCKVYKAEVLLDGIILASHTGAVINKIAQPGALSV